MPSLIQSLFCFIIMASLVFSQEPADTRPKELSFAEAMANVREFPPEILSYMGGKTLVESSFMKIQNLDDYRKSSTVSALDYIEGLLSFCQRNEVPTFIILKDTMATILLGRKDSVFFFFGLNPDPHIEDMERLRDYCFEMGVRAALPYRLSYRSEWGGLNTEVTREVLSFLDNVPPYFTEKDPQGNSWQKHRRIALLEVCAAIKVTLGDLCNEDELMSFARDALWNVFPIVPYDKRGGDSPETMEINDLMKQYLTITARKQARIENIILRVKEEMRANASFDTLNVPYVSEKSYYRKATMLDHILKFPPQKLSDIVKLLFASIHGFFNDVVELDADAPNSGWKIHVGGNLETAPEVARLVLPYLLEKNIPSKIVNSEGSLRKMTGTQAGKLFTIYPKNYQEAQRIATELNDLLNDFQSHRAGGPIILSENEKPFGDAELGESGLLFVRYGQHRERRNGAHNVTRVAADGDRQNDYVKDAREVPFPDFVLQFKPEVFGGSDQPFPMLNFRWAFPGTARVLGWDDMVQGWGHILDQGRRATVSNQERYNAILTAIGARATTK